MRRMLLGKPAADAAVEAERVAKAVANAAEEEAAAATAQEELDCLPHRERLARARSVLAELEEEEEAGARRGGRREHQHGREHHRHRQLEAT
jgi:hypothetical protein